MTIKTCHFFLFMYFILSFFLFLFVYFFIYFFVGVGGACILVDYQTGLRE